MLNKINKFLKIILVGIILLVSVPFASYASGTYVTTGIVTNITPTSATFNGTVDTGGLPGSAWFEYGTDISFGNSTSLNAYNFSGGYSGNYSSNIAGLAANTTYYVRAIAQNYSYGRMYGTVVSFTTNFPTSGYSNYNNYGYNNNGYYDNYSGYNNNSMSPVAITTAGEVLSSNTAQFKALILPGNSSEANTWFEWGTTPNLGNQTVIVPINGAPAIRHTNTITGLTPGTAYYFRAVAQNSYGKNEGVVLSLVTNGSAPSIRKNTTSTTTNTTTTNVSGITSMADTTSVDRSINGAPTASMLGANVFGASSFFPSNLFGWLLILVMILAVVFLSRRLHGQIKNQEEHK